VINNEDDILLNDLASCQSLAIAINRAAPSDMRYTLFCGEQTSGRFKRWSPSVRPSVLHGTWQLKIRTDPKYFLSLLVRIRYSVVADGRRSWRSSRSHTFLARAITCNYTYTVHQEKNRTLVFHRNLATMDHYLQNFHHRILEKMC